MRRPAVLAVVLLSLVAPSRALAADGDDADALIRHGLLLRREGKDGEALEEFRRAYALEPAPRTRAQIALAEQALGRWVEAEDDLVQALGTGDDAWIASHRSLLDTGLASIRGHLGWLTVTADVASAELWVNDARVGTLPLAQPLRIEAGSAVVEVRAEGYAPARRLATIEPGVTAREAVHLVALVAPAPGGDVPVPTRAGEPAVRTRVVPANRALRTTGYAVGGAGLVGLAAGAYFGVETFQKKSERDAQCTPGCTQAGVTYDGEARSFALDSTVLIIAGAVAVGAGVGLLWVSRSRIVVTPQVGADRAGVMVGGSW
jgi:hypothetical protein